MTAYTLYSAEKEAEALALIGETSLGQNEAALLRQLLLILCNNDISTIGATGIGPIAPNILKQIVIAAATQ